MFVLKSLASHGDLRTWTAYACDGSGQGRAVQAEIGTGQISVTVAGRIYDCTMDAPQPMESLSVGVIRRIMLAVLALDIQRFMNLDGSTIHENDHPGEINLAQVG